MCKLVETLGMVSAELKRSKYRV